MSKRRRYSAAYKFKVALATARGDKTQSQLAQEYQLHPSQISTWKRQLLEEGERVFERGGGRSEREQAAREAALYEQIGRLRMELEWLKKTTVAKRARQGGDWA
ncbi:MAG: transposase [Anaerolineae bacterium]|nr:transposase [Anaerolineae bacterium]